MNQEFQKYKDLVFQNWVFEMNGTCNPYNDREVTNNEVNNFESYLEKFNSSKLRKIGTYILVELRQIIYREGILNKNYKITIGKSESELVYMSETIIFQQNKSKLIEEFEELSSLNNDIKKMKEYYINKLRNCAGSDFVEGYRFEIIDLARKSVNGLLYNFADINENETFFSLIVRIDLEKKLN